MPISVQSAVERLIEARTAHRLAAPLSESEPGVTLEQAYAIQDAVRAELVRRGDRISGWKVGVTSQAAREAMGVDHPIAGFLLRSGQFASGAEVPLSRFANLGVEVEVAFRLRSGLVGPGVTPDSARLAVEGAFAALELPDFLFSGKPTAADFVADGVHANAIVLASPLAPIRTLDLALEGIVY